MSFLDDPSLDETTPPVEELQKGGDEGESK